MMARSSSLLAVLVVALAVLMLGSKTEAFVKGQVPSRRLAPMEIEDGLRVSTHLYAAKKKKAKKKTAAKKATAEVVTLSKKDIVKELADKTGMTQAAADDALAAVLSTITENVSAGKKITFVGFGSFELRERAARSGRNPQTGEPMEIKASNYPAFSASKIFKELCN